MQLSQILQGLQDLVWKSARHTTKVVQCLQNGAGMPLLGQQCIGLPHTWISNRTTENSYANAMLPMPVKTAHVLEAGLLVNPLTEPVEWPPSADASAIMACYVNHLGLHHAIADCKKLPGWSLNMYSKAAICRAVCFSLQACTADKSFHAPRMLLTDICKNRCICL